MSEPFDVILFDVGDVLTRGAVGLKLADLAVKYRLDAKRLVALRQRYRVFADLGRISDASFWRLVLEDCGVAMEPADACLADCLHPIEGTLALARRLRGRYRIGILSNDSRELAQARRARFGFDELFDPILISSVVGLVKPDQRIYDHALRRLGVAAARCLFIDNRQDNVDAARARGMRAVLFTDAARLERDLTRLGVQLTPSRG